MEEELVVFKIIQNVSGSGLPKYVWRYFEVDSWVDSQNWSDTKSACLVDFITETGNLRNLYIDGIDSD